MKAKCRHCGSEEFVTRYGVRWCRWCGTRKKPIPHLPGNSFASYLAAKARGQEGIPANDKPVEFGS